MAWPSLFKLQSNYSHEIKIYFVLRSSDLRGNKVSTQVIIVRFKTVEVVMEVEMEVEMVMEVEMEGSCKCFLIVTSISIVFESIIMILTEYVLQVFL